MNHTRIHHGVDLVHVSRVRDLLARHADFEGRIFRADERAYCRRHADPAPHFAARFAAKEATLKALGLGIAATGIDQRLADVEVRRAGTAPTLALGGRAAAAAESLQIVSTAVSLSHDGDLALASVIMLSEVTS